ncbi:gypsy retrotransposon integrase-like protein 1 [Plakobranchus ocellatus]|uniref:Gypsy retrotransposon integrase-like protein 1 n=1 Tax=Plakobranchus ocellatus TaxID=259542 RepID=A0AAV4DRI4_9GAST|nr:gypsy retrotransposon integrase-like protein 1 [Plakobranchus ocellatus]
MRNGKRTYHANILKKYEKREPSPPLQPVVENACTGFVRHKEYEEIGIIMLEPKRKEYPRDVTIGEKLTPQQNKEARELLQTFPDTLNQEMLNIRTHIESTRSKQALRRPNRSFKQSHCRHIIATT